MSDIIHGKGIERTHIRSRFTAESLVDREVIRSTFSERELPILPDVHMIKIGGLSIFDRGKKALFPLIEEIIEAKKKHKMIIGVGGGTRERHTYAIGIDLGLPVGGLAMIAGAIPEQNALLLQVLLARAGGIRIPKDHFEELPMYLSSGAIPIIVGMPPYHYWEHPPEMGKIPPHGSDTGVYLLSEVFSTKSCIFIKDVDGLFTEDPKKNPDAKLIPQIAVSELMRMNLRDLPVERTVIEIMQYARNSRRIQIINGLKPGNLLRALNGENAGTVIYV